MRTYKIHFIRHGETDGNVEGKYIGVTDIPLTNNGRKELSDLREDGIYPSVGLVFTSPLKRCIESCEEIFPNRDYFVVDEMKEYNFGDFEGKTAAELENEEDFIKWTSNQIPSPPNGEDSKEFAARICLGLNKIVRQMMNNDVYEAAVVTHGGIIMTLFACAALPRHKAVEWACEYGKGYTVTVTPSLYAKSGIIEVTDTVPSLEN